MCLSICELDPEALSQGEVPSVHVCERAWPRLRASGVCREEGVALHQGHQAAWGHSWRLCATLS